MSSSSSWRTPRRNFLLASLAWPLAGLASPVAGWRERGSGSYRRFGIVIYDARLWTAGAGIEPPLALRLDYRRRLSGAAIAAASVAEMRRQVDDPALLAVWEKALLAIFPDVAAGDHLLGVWQPDGAYFYRDATLLGALPDARFARHFFGIWLDPRSSDPALRAALLGAAA